MASTLSAFRGFLAHTSRLHPAPHTPLARRTATSSVGEDARGVQYVVHLHSNQAMCGHWARPLKLSTSHRSLRGRQLPPVLPSRPRTRPVHAGRYGPLPNLRRRRGERMGLHLPQRWGISPPGARAEGVRPLPLPPDALSRPHPRRDSCKEAVHPRAPLPQLPATGDHLRGRLDDRTRRVEFRGTDNLCRGSEDVQGLGEGVRVSVRQLRADERAAQSRLGGHEPDVYLR